MTHDLYRLAAVSVFALDLAAGCCAAIHLPAPLPLGGSGLAQAGILFGAAFILAESVSLVVPPTPPAPKRKPPLKDRIVAALRRTLSSR